MNTAASMPRVHNKYHRTAGPDAVYIGRGSPWGNPFRVDDPHPTTGEPMDRSTVIAEHEAWLLRQPRLVARVRRELAGRDLVCFCAPKPCHGDTLIRIANSTPSTQEDPR